MNSLLSTLSLIVLNTAILTYASESADVGSATASPTSSVKSEDRKIFPAGLHRLDSSGRAPTDDVLSPEKYEILDISSLRTTPQSGSEVFDQRGLYYLALLPSREWKRPLRRFDKIGYVTFTLHASLGSEINVGGARLTVLEGRRIGFGGIAIGESPTVDSIVHHTRLMRYAGAEMGTLAVVTVALDRASNTWSLFLGLRMVAYDQPLGNGSTEFKITAGAEGAWLCDLIYADDNPLYRDANSNGFPDQFEERKLGAILQKPMSAEQKGLLMKSLRDDFRTLPLPPLFVAIPGPDSIQPSSEIAR